MNTIIYKTHFELMNTLTDAQAGLLIKAIGIYCSGVMPTFNDQLVQGIFLGLRHDFDTQAQNYENKVKRNQENGKNGGRPKKPTITEDNPKNPMGYLETEETQHNPKNLKDKDKDKDKDIEKEKGIDKDKLTAVYNAPDTPVIEDTDVDYMIDETDIELTRPMLERVMDKFLAIDSRFKLQSVMSEINEDYGGFDNLIELYLPNDTSAQMKWKGQLQQYKNGIYA